MEVGWNALLCDALKFSPSTVSALYTHQDAVASICELGLKEQYESGRLSPI